MRKTIILFLVFLINIQLIGQTNKLHPCKKGEYYCFCDTSDNIVFNEQWQYVSDFNNGYARVVGKKGYAYIDSTGKYESNCTFFEMGRFHNGYTWTSNREGEIDIIDTKCEIKFSKTHTGGEHGAAFFDSIIIIYALNEMNECGNTDNSFGAVDYNFNIVIPFKYENILKSTSDRYYFVSRSGEKGNEESCPVLWGIYDIVKRKEVVSCRYKGSLSSEAKSEITPSKYTFNYEKDFLLEMKKYNIALPNEDEINDQINGIFKW